MRGDMIRLSFCNTTPTMEQRLDGEDRDWRQGSHWEVAACKSPSKS